MNNNYEYYNALIDKSEEFNKYKLKTINEIQTITKSSEYEQLNFQWSYMYISKYGINRFKLINYLIHSIYRNKNKIIKKILNIYLKFETWKLEKKLENN